MEKFNKTFRNIVTGNFMHVIEDSLMLDLSTALSTLNEYAGVEFNEEDSVDVTYLENLWRVIESLGSEEEQGEALRVAHLLGLSPEKYPEANVSALGIICMAMDGESIAKSLLAYKAYYDLGLVPKNGMAILMYHVLPPSYFDEEEEGWQIDDERIVEIDSIKEILEKRGMMEIYSIHDELHKNNPIF